jgi:hypothetical protein
VETCIYCHTSLPVEDAMDQGWIPDFWDMATNSPVWGPVCLPCQQREGVVYDEDQGDYVRPALPAPDATAEGKGN